MKYQIVGTYFSSSMKYFVDYHKKSESKASVPKPEKEKKMPNKN